MKKLVFKNNILIIKIFFLNLVYKKTYLLYLLK